MAMGHVFEVAFAISATMSGSFRSAMSQSSAQMRNLGNTARSISAQTRQLNRAWQQSTAQMKQYGQQLVSLRKQFEQGRITEAQYTASTQRIRQAMQTAGMSAEEYRTHLQRLQQQMRATREAQARMQAALSARKTAAANFSASQAGLMTGAATVAMVAAPAVAMINTAAQFEAAMSKVRAITRASDQDFQQLTNTARELGEKTQFSARESAEAMQYLGMAGWNTNQIISGMPGLLALAAAGGTDLATTADIVSDDLTAFGLSAENAGHMADVFAVASTRTNTNVRMLGETMKYAAPVAHAFGVSMEETAALAGIMANSGIKASQAGTALRSGFLRLAGPPKMAQKAMDQLGMSMQDITAEQKEAAMAMESLGIKMSDTNGPRKMSSILRDLRDKTKDLGNEEKLAALKAIFGTEAATGWMAVLESGPETFDALVTEMENSDGEAAKMANTMNDNARGASIRLKSAIESLSISIGGTFLPAIARGADMLAKYAGALSRVAAQHPGVITGIMGMAGAAVGLFAYVRISHFVADAFKLLKAQYEVIKNLKMAENIAKIGSAISKLGPIVSRVGAAFMRAGAAMLASPTGLIIIGIIAVIAALYLLYKNFDKVKTFAANAWNTIATTASAAWNRIVSTVSGAWNSIKNGASSAWNGIVSGVRAVPGMIMGGIRAVFSFIGSISGRIAFVVGFIIGALMALPGRIRSIITAVVQWFSRLPSACVAAGTAFVAAASAWLSQAYSTVVTWITNMVQGAYNSLMNLPGYCMAAGSAFISAASAWLSAAYATVVSWLTQLVQSAYEWLMQLPEYCAEAGAQFVAAASEWASGAYDAVINWISQIPGKISEVIGGAWNNIKNQFSEGITIGVRTVTEGGGDGGGEPEANAIGGIYNKGAFLTWFAEDSAEAAIPLDGSPRAVGLWKRAGQLLGFDTSNIDRNNRKLDLGRLKPGAAPSSAAPRIMTDNVAQEPETATMAPQFTFNINVNGSADNIERLKKAVADAGHMAGKSFADKMKEYEHEKRRRNYAY